MRAKIEGFIVYVLLQRMRKAIDIMTYAPSNSFDYADQYASAAAEMAGWIAEGKLKSKYHVVEGISQAPDALLLLFNGGNTGKL